MAIKRLREEKTTVTEQPRIKRLRDVTPSTTEVEKPKEFITPYAKTVQSLKQPVKEEKKPTRLETPKTSITKVKEQAEQLKKIGEASTRSAMAAQAKAKETKKVARDKEIESLPIGAEQYVRAMEFLAEKTRPAAKIAEALYTPGAGASVIGGATKGAEAAISRLLPALAKTVGGRALKTGLTEAAVGVPTGAGQVLAYNPQASAEEVLKGAAYGGGGGSILGAGGKLAGEGINRLRNIIRTHVAEPTPAISREVQPVAGEAIPPVKQDNEWINNAKRNAKETELNSPLGINQDSSIYMKQIPKEISSQYDAHGMAKGYGRDIDNLVKLLREGIDPNKPFYTARLSDDVPGLSVFNSGSFIVTGEKGRGIKEGIRNVIVNDVYYDSIPDLQREFPNINFIRADEAPFKLGRELLPYHPTVQAVGANIIPEAEAMKGNWFTNLFGKQGVGITPGLQRGGRNILTTEGQIVDQPLRNDIEGVKAQTKNIVRTIYNNQVDFVKPLKYIDEEAYDAAHDVRRANNLANTSIQDKFVDLQGNVLGPSLKEIGNKIARGESNAFEDYLILRHARTRMERGERVYDPNLRSAPKTPAEVQERIDMLDRRYPNFSGIASEWDGYNANLRNIGVQEELISDSQRAAMEIANPYYASMRRQFTTAEKYSQPFAMKTRGFSGQKAPIKEVSPTGSARKIVSPFRSAIEQTGAWYNAAMRNRVMQTIYNRVNADPEALKGIINIVPETTEATKKSVDEINDVLNTEGMEGLMERLNDELSIMFRKGGQKGARTDNIVTAMIKGHPVKLRVENPEVFKALVGMGPEESNFVLDVIGSLSKATKYGATGPLAPLFAARSLTTDIAQAIIQSKNPMAHLYDLTHSIVSSIADKFPKGTPGIDKIRELAQDFSRTGGEYSAALMGDRALRQSVGGILRQPILTPKGIARTTGQAIASPFRFLNSISDISENVNRMSAYKGALRRQGNVRTPEAIRTAMRESQEITTNFSRKGAKSDSIERFIPYNNAAVQGLRRFAKQWQENPVKTAALVGGLVIAPKIYEYAKFHEDPDYQKITAREKYRNIIIGKNEDGTFVKIPMSPEYNAIGAAINDILVAYKDGDPVNWRQISDAISNAYTPPWLSGALQGQTQGGGIEQSIRGVLGATSISPISAITAGPQGQSFTGAPIVSQRLAGASPEQQYDERTSSIAKEIGKRVGLSPLKVDYLIRSYGGDPARLLLPLTSPMGAGTPRNTLLKNFIVDPVFSNTLSTDYYDLKEKITQSEEDKRLQDVEYPSWYKEDVADYITNNRKNGISKRITGLNNEKREIQGDKTLNPQQKANKLREIQSQQNQIYLDAVIRMRESGVPTGR